ncbi:MAG: DUF2029 domain-containing protein [Phycisphaerales bacterium]|nr:DUF2029 domain-containing protein [Phycisphaerales bacterium]
MRGLCRAWTSGWFIAWMVVFALLTGIFGFRANELDKCYLKAADRFVAGENIYAPTSDGIGYWTYPPGMILTVAPLAWVPEWVARVLWGALLAAAAVVCVRCIVRVVMQGVAAAQERRRRVIAMIVAAALAHQVILSPLTYFSHDLIIACALGVALWATVSSRDAMAGGALGVGAAFKVTPALFAVALLLERRWRALVVMVCAGMLVTAAPDILRGQWRLPLVREFAQIALRASDITSAGGGYWHSWNPLAQNLSASIARLTTPTPSGDRDINQRDWSLVHLTPQQRSVATGTAQAAVLGAVMVVVLLGVKRNEEGSAPLARLNEFGALACGMVLLSPHSSNYHFAIEYFAILSCVIVAWRTRDPFMVVCVAALAILGLPSGRDLVGNYAVDAMLIYGKLTAGALVALAGCVRAGVLLRAARVPP